MLLVLMEALVHQNKSLVLILVKQKQIFFCLHYNYDNSYLFVNGKRIYKFKSSNGNNNFPTWFYLGSISDEFNATESRDISFGETV